MITADFTYWNTLYLYLRNRNGELNGDIVNDAKIINKAKKLWQIASYNYLQNISVNDLLEMCIRNPMDEENYMVAYDAFLWYLFYASDRMCVNRWLKAQNTIMFCADKIYTEYEYNFDSSKWDERVLGGEIGANLYGIDVECENEWKQIILPAIKLKNII